MRDLVDKPFRIFSYVQLTTDELQLYYQHLAVRCSGNVVGNTDEDAICKGPVSIEMAIG